MLRVITKTSYQQRLLCRWHRNDRHSLARSSPHHENRSPVPQPLGVILPSAERFSAHVHEDSPLTTRLAQEARDKALREEISSQNPTLLLARQPTDARAQAAPEPESAARQSDQGQSAGGATRTSPRGAAPSAGTLARAQESPRALAGAGTPRMAAQPRLTNVIIGATTAALADATAALQPRQQSLREPAAVQAALSPALHQPLRTHPSPIGSPLRHHVQPLPLGQVAPVPGATTPRSQTIKEVLGDVGEILDAPIHANILSERRLLVDVMEGNALSSHTSTTLLESFRLCREPTPYSMWIEFPARLRQIFESAQVTRRQANEYVRACAPVAPSVLLELIVVALEEQRLVVPDASTAQLTRSALRTAQGETTRLDEKERLGAYAYMPYDWACMCARRLMDPTIARCDWLVMTRISKGARSSAQVYNCEKYDPRILRDVTAYPVLVYSAYLNICSRAIRECKDLPETPDSEDEQRSGFAPWPTSPETRYTGGALWPSAGMSARSSRIILSDVCRIISHRQSSSRDR